MSFDDTYLGFGRQSAELAVLRVEVVRLRAALATAERERDVARRWARAWKLCAVNYREMGVAIALGVFRARANGDAREG